MVAGVTLRLATVAQVGADVRPQVDAVPRRHHQYEGDDHADSDHDPREEQPHARGSVSR